MNTLQEIAYALECKFQWTFSGTAGCFLFKVMCGWGCIGKMFCSWRIIISTVFWKSVFGLSLFRLLDELQNVWRNVFGQWFIDSVSLLKKYITKEPSVNIDISFKIVTNYSSVILIFLCFVYYANDTNWKTLIVLEGRVEVIIRLLEIGTHTVGIMVHFW